MMIILIGTAYANANDVTRREILVDASRFSDNDTQPTLAHIIHTFYVGPSADDNADPCGL